MPAAILESCRQVRRRVSLAGKLFAVIGSDDSDLADDVRVEVVQLVCRDPKFGVLLPANYLDWELL